MHMPSPTNTGQRKSMDLFNLDPWPKARTKAPAPEHVSAGGCCCGTGEVGDIPTPVATALGAVTAGAPTHRTCRQTAERRDASQSCHHNQPVRPFPGYQCVVEVAWHLLREPDVKIAHHIQRGHDLLRGELPDCSFLRVAAHAHLICDPASCNAVIHATRSLRPAWLLPHDELRQASFADLLSPGLIERDCNHTQSFRCQKKSLNFRKSKPSTELAGTSRTYTTPRLNQLRRGRTCAYRAHRSSAGRPRAS